MRKLTEYRSLIFASAAMLVVGLMALFTLGVTTKWVGRTDLEIRFVVTDAETGQPIPDAAIDIRDEPGGFCDDAPQPKFTMTTDEIGHATHLAKNCMCGGSEGIFEDAFASHLPHWSFHATATGYSANDPAYLNFPENARQVQRGDPFATLSLPIRLRRNAEKQ